MRMSFTHALEVLNGELPEFARFPDLSMIALMEPPMFALMEPRRGTVSAFQTE